MSPAVGRGPSAAGPFARTQWAGERASRGSRRRNLRGLLALLRPYRARCVTMLAALVVGTAATLAPPLLAKVAIDRGIEQHSMSTLVLVVIAFLASALLVWVMTYVQTYLVGNSLVGSNAVSARRWFVGGSDRLKAIVASSFKTFGIAIYSRPETRPGGELGVVYTDAPSFHIIDHAIYHTDLDRAELVPEPGLEAAVRAFAKIIDEVNKVDMTALRVVRASDQPR